MCAIVDANVVGEIFGKDKSPAGNDFLDWIRKGTNRLIAGGYLLDELNKNSAFKREALEFLRSQKMKVVDKSVVNARAKQIRASGLCRSNDPHVIALAQVSGARLLFSNDEVLSTDFKSKALLDRPRGKVLTTDGDVPVKYRDFSTGQRKLLNSKTCAMP